MHPGPRATSERNNPEPAGDKTSREGAVTELELLRLLQPIVHYSLHLLAPGLIAWVFFRTRWRRAWLIMVATMLVDLDHLLAYPDVFVPDRCGIDFHPLHTRWAMVGYAALALFPKTRVIALGLLLHMATDAQDCLWMAALRGR